MLNMKTEIIIDFKEVLEMMQEFKQLVQTLKNKGVIQLGDAKDITIKVSKYTEK